MKKYLFVLLVLFSYCFIGCTNDVSNSSTSKNNGQSLALQQAKNAMEATFALTGASYPAGTDFIVDDGKDGKIDYWFSYEGNTLRDVGVAGGKVAQYQDGFYVAYFSSKCFNKTITAKDSDATTLADSTLYLRSEALLLQALKLNGGASSLNFDSVATGGYVTLTYEVTGKNASITIVRLYYTRDIEPTIVIILGAN